MDSDTNICLDRANNELLLASAIHLLSNEPKVKEETFNLPREITFYSAVIAHAYYSIFYSAKAYLISKGFAVPEQGQHNAVYQKFKKIVKTGELNHELLIIYEDTKVKAEILLSILEYEEEKRTEYTYKKLPQANKEPAEKSLENASFFISHIKEFINLSSRSSSPIFSP